MSTAPSDAALVKRVQQNDRHAFDLLILRHQQRIHNVIMRYVRDHSQALDVAQVAFYKAYRALPTFRGHSAFYTWLYRIAVNTAKNHRAAMKRCPLMFETDSCERSGLGAHLPVEIATPENQVLAEELQAEVLQAVAALPAYLRTALVLREVEGLSYEEIARATECPLGTVRSRIHRARAAIDERIRPLMDRHEEPA